MKNNERLIVSLGLLGILIADASPALAGMENVRFSLHYKPAFSPTESVPSLCDDPATPNVEANYSPNFDNLSCDQYTVNAPLGPSTVYVVVARAGEEGIAAVAFGVAYYGEDPDSTPGTGDDTGILSSQTTWTSCANGLFFPNDAGNGEFPASRAGVRITWNLETSCQTQSIGNDGVYAVVGCFHVYAYSSATRALTANERADGPGGPELAVADCSGKTTELFWRYWPNLHQALAKVQFGSGSGANNPCTGVVPVQPNTWGKLKHIYK